MMMNIERKIIDYILKYQNVLFIFIVVLLSFLLRYSGRDFYSGDMMLYLMPWSEYYKENGFGGLAQGIGDYNLLYQTILAVFSRINIESVYLIKMLSVVFDYATAFFVAEKVCEYRNEKRFGFVYNLIVFVLLFSPTIVLNSSFWGQCDSIYSFFIILFLYYLFKGKYIKAFIFWGIALAFKFQAIFVVPIVVVLYFKKKTFSVFNLLITIFVFWLSGIVAYVNGSSIKSVFRIYFNQIEKTDSVKIWNMYSFWNIGAFSSMKFFCMVIFLILCGVGLYYILTCRKEINSLEDVLKIICWFLWVCVLFLPEMHERYTYLLDIFLIICSFFNKKYVKYAIVGNILSLITYYAYLSDSIIEKQQLLLMSIIYFVFWCSFSYHHFFVSKENNKVDELI